VPEVDPCTLLLWWCWVQVEHREEQLSQLRTLFEQLQAGREQLKAKLQRAYADVGLAEERERARLEEARGLEKRLEKKQGQSTPSRGTDIRTTLIHWGVGKCYHLNTAG
jgi:septal ring factor EnvC (AmiA/AmiB activator)